MVIKRNTRFLFLGLLLLLGGFPSLVKAQCPSQYKYIKLVEGSSAATLASQTPTVVSILTVQGWNGGNFVKPNSTSRPRGLAISKKSGVTPVALPQESQLWTVSGTLTQIIPATDGDYHLVISDSSKRTMIAEIVDPKCLSSTNLFTTPITAVRKYFDANYASMLGKTINVTGPAFFDKAHKQTGASPNQAEIHPVLIIN